MQYVNPYEILGFDRNMSLSELSSDLIKRAKKQLFAEVELNDNVFNYGLVQLTKADCAKAIDDLDDDLKRRLHYFVFRNKALNDFLVDGNLALFNKHQLESIYTSPEFIDFVSPYFAFRFDKALLKAFTSKNNVLLTSILKYEYLIDSRYINDAYRSLNIELSNRIEKVKALKDEIKRGNARLISHRYSEPLSEVKSDFPIELLNSLPRYFQSLIDLIAESINYLQLEMENAFETQLALLECVKALNVESVSKPIYEKNYEIVKRQLENQREQEKYGPVLKKWAGILSQINESIKSVDQKTVKSNSLPAKLNTLVSISELNSLGEFANEIRTRIGYSLRSLSISCWNSQNDIDSAITFIRIALQVNVASEAKDKFAADLKELSRLKTEKERQGEPMQSAPSLRTVNGIGTTIYGSTLYFVILAFPVIPIARYNCTPTGTGYRFHGKLKLHKWQQIWKWGLLGGIALWILIAIIQSNSDSSTSSYNTTTTPSLNSSQSQPYSSSSDTSSAVGSTSANSYSSDSSSTASNSLPNSNSGLPTAPELRSVTMKNGNISGCLGVIPQYDRDIDNKLIISAEMTDVAVKIISYETDQCIRFVFVKDGTTYIARHIPEGKYYLKIAYGYDWSVREGDPPCMGHFVDRPSYKKDLSMYDYNGNISIPYYTLKLYRTYTSGYSTDSESGNSISEDEFSNN